MSDMASRFNRPARCTPVGGAELKQVGRRLIAWLFAAQHAREASYKQNHICGLRGHEPRFRNLLPAAERASAAGARRNGSTATSGLAGGAELN
jgi:hypothetical protein